MLIVVPRQGWGDSYHSHLLHLPVGGVYHNIGEGRGRVDRGDSWCGLQLCHRRGGEEKFPELFGLCWRGGDEGLPPGNPMVVVRASRREGATLKLPVVVVLMAALSWLLGAALLSKERR